MVGIFPGRASVVRLVGLLGLTAAATTSATVPPTRGRPASSLPRGRGRTGRMPCSNPPHYPDLRSGQGPRAHGDSSSCSTSTAPSFLLSRDQSPRRGAGQARALLKAAGFARRGWPPGPPAVLRGRTAPGSTSGNLALAPAKSLWAGHIGMRKAAGLVNQLNVQVTVWVTVRPSYPVRHHPGRSCDSHF